MEKTWLILREPGCVPQRKGPFPDGHLAGTLREFMAARPGAFITVLRCEGEPSVEDGPQCLEVIDGRSRSVARRHLETSRAAFARCPRCNSPNPVLHPAVQHEGEVQMCQHPWHKHS